MAGGNRERHVEQDLAVGFVAEIDVLDAHFRSAHRERLRTRCVDDLCVLLDQLEQPLHVGEGLFDLAIDDAEEIQRDVELDHERIDEHEIADRHRAGDDADRRAPHDQRDRDRDDRALPDVERGQRRLALDGGMLPALQALVVAPRLPLLVAEVLDCLVVEQAVDRSRVRLRVELVHLPAKMRAPFGDHDREQHVERQRDRSDRHERPVVARDQHRGHQRDLDECGQDREQREADQRRDAALATLDVSRQSAGLPRQVKAQRQRVQVPEDLSDRCGAPRAASPWRTGIRAAR